MTIKNITYETVKWVIGIICGASLLYAQFATVKKDIPVIQASLKEHEKEIYSQKTDIAVLMERTDYVVRSLERLTGKDYNGK